MNRVVNNFIHMVVIAYITILYAIVLPTHYHNDFTLHNDCVLCLMSNLSAIMVVGLVIVVIAVSLWYLVPISPLLFELILTETRSARAPPH